MLFKIRTPLLINMSLVEAIFVAQRASEEPELLNVPVLEVIDLHKHAYSISGHSFPTMRHKFQAWYWYVIDVLAPSYRP